MKMTTLFSTLALTAALVVPTQRAEAGSNERAFVAGVVGGALLHHAATSHYRPRVTTTRVTYSSRAPRYREHRRSTYVTSARSNSYVTERVHVSRPSGHYVTRHEKVWVPGYREKTRLSCGTWVVRNHPGHYEVRPRRVYVESSRTRHRPRHRRVVYTR